VYRKFWQHVAPDTANKNSVTIMLRLLAAMFQHIRIEMTVSR
jgi:hypothetical protein